MTQLIGLTGRKRSGKTTAAQILERHGYYQMSFSGTIKQMGCVLLRNLGLREEEISWHQENKEAMIPRLGRSYREILQKLGTEWGRLSINPNIWLTTAGIEIDMMPVEMSIVFDDVRFENEAAWIRGRGGQVIHVMRDLNDIVDHHASEAGVAVCDEDSAIGNAGSLDEFERNLLALVGIEPKNRNPEIRQGDYHIEFFDACGNPMPDKTLSASSVSQAHNLAEKLFKQPTQTGESLGDQE